MFGLSQHTESEMSIYSIRLQWQIKFIHQSSPNEPNFAEMIESEKSNKSEVGTASHVE